MRGYCRPRSGIGLEITKQLYPCDPSSLRPGIVRSGRLDVNFWIQLRGFSNQLETNDTRHGQAWSAGENGFRNYPAERTRRGQRPSAIAQGMTRRSKGGGVSSPVKSPPGNADPDASLRARICDDARLHSRLNQAPNPAGHCPLDMPWRVARKTSLQSTRLTASRYASRSAN